MKYRDILKYVPSTDLSVEDDSYDYLPNENLHITVIDSTHSIYVVVESLADGKMKFYPPKKTLKQAIDLCEEIDIRHYCCRLDQKHLEPPTEDE